MKTNDPKFTRNTAMTAAPDGSTPQPASAPGLTVTHYQQLADDVLRALDQIIQTIPNLEVKHPATANFVRTHLNVPVKFLATAIVAVDQEPDLQSVNKLNVSDGREILQYNEAFRPVLDKFAAAFSTLKFTLDSGQANLAADALQVYAIARELSRDPGGAHLLVHVNNLKRDLGRRGRAKGSATAARQPAPPFAPARAQEGKTQG